MRPDYTLSIWPSELTAKQAEIQELIVHIHFDAKYKIDRISEILDEHEKENLDLDKEESRAGIYKRADILKMHAYKDAIRRTSGAYILYPGSTPLQKTGFHEVLPGLGAFPLKPTRTDNGTLPLKEFLYQVLEHFLNRASQRERLSYRIFDIHQEKSNNKLKVSLPEIYNNKRALPPDETFVLVAYIKDKNHENWIISNNLYNVRMDAGKGSLKLGPAEVGATYLLLHSKNNLITSNLWRIIESGPRIFSKNQMLKKGYNFPSQDFYLVYKIEKVDGEEFNKVDWDIRKLSGYKNNRNSGIPFSISLTELMQATIK